MNFYSAFAPPYWEHEKRIDALRQSMRRQWRQRSRISKATRELQDEVGLLALTLLALVGRLVEKGIVTEAELHARIAEVDALDGEKDGMLDPEALRSALGLPARPRTPPKAPAPKARRRRKRR